MILFLYYFILISLVEDIESEAEIESSVEQPADDEEKPKNGKWAWLNPQSPTTTTQGQGGEA